MPAHTSDPETPVGAQVSSYLSELFPDDIADTSTISFTGSSVTRDTSDTAFDDAESLRTEVGGVVSRNGQLVVSVTQRAINDDGSVNRIRTTLSRVLDGGVSELSPFYYTVDVRGSIRDTGIVSLADIKDTHVYGGIDGFGAVFLAEAIAYRMQSRSTASDRDAGKSYASFSWYGSLHSAIDEQRIRIDGWTITWDDIIDTIGPDSDTVVSNAYVRSGYPETVQKRIHRSIPFVTDTPQLDASSIDSYRAKQLYQRIIASSIADPVPGVSVSPAFVRQQVDGFASLVEQLPDDVCTALDNGDFGRAQRFAETTDASFTGCVMIYAFHEFYRALANIHTSTDAVVDMSNHIDTAVTAMRTGNLQDARTALHDASTAFVTVTEDLSSTAVPTLQELRGMLIYTGMIDTFETRLANDGRLDNDSLQAYQSIASSLVKYARKQSERGELARELQTIVAN